jgi:hypothetical protein
MDDEVQGLAWEHNKDLCEARVGRALRWADVDGDGDRKGSWRYGRKVTRIHREPSCWMVELELGRAADGWHNPISAGDRVRVIGQPAP